MLRLLVIIIYHPYVFPNNINKMKIVSLQICYMIVIAEVNPP